MVMTPTTTVVAPTVTSVVDRGHIRELNVGMMLKKPSLKCHEMHIHIIKREGLRLGGHRCDEGIILNR